MNKIITLLTCLFTISGLAQNTDKYPHYFNSLSLEFSSPASYISDVVRTHQANLPYTLILLPSVFINYEGRIKNKFYGEGGFSYGNRISGFSISNDTFPYRYSDYNWYGGAIFKQRLFKNFYFTPSFDIYYTLRKTFYHDILQEKSSYLTMGPTIGFEYFISKRVSLNTDLLNINWGLHFYNDPFYNPNESFISTHNNFTIYKVFSIGIHYNFGWKKKLQSN